MNSNELRLDALCEKLHFYFWIEELKNLHPWPNYVESGLCWKDYYDDGYSPTDAMLEDMGER